MWVASHSSRMVRWTRSTQPLVCGRPAWMKRCWAPAARTALPNSWDLNSEPLSVIAALSFQPAAASSSATRRARADVKRALGLSSVRCTSAQTKELDTSIAVMLLWLSSRGAGKQWVDLAGNVALQAANDLHLAEPFPGAAAHVVTCPLI